jgi:ABC-type dipeptide/oligopeptide/nickel transport system permease subunit
LILKLELRGCCRTDLRQPRFFLIQQEFFADALCLKRILTASSLSYLGVGIQPPTPEWGAIISEAKEFLRIAPLYCILPGLVMVVMSLCFNLLGDGLRDAMDPRLKD